MSANGGIISLTKLSAIHERVESLRKKLTEAYVGEGIRLEIAIFEVLDDLFQNVLKPYFSESSLGSSVEQIEGRLVICYYLQDILAAALFLMDEADFAPHFNVSTCPEWSARGTNASDFYVSKSQRAFCAEIFMYLCWCPWIPTHVVIQALYPLADSGSVRNDNSGAPCYENGVALDMLHHFKAKRHFLTTILNGVVLARPKGIPALLRVLLLDDRVESGMSIAASEQIVSLLTSNMSPAWLPSDQTHDNTTVSRKDLSSEDQAKLICSQMVPLFEEQSAANAVEVTTTPGESSPTFLQKLSRSKERLLPPETLAERLHVCLAMWLNRALALPPRESKGFAEAYKRFFYVNKYFLTPAFGHLSLRVKRTSEREMLLALQRLGALAKGAEDGAASTSLLTVLEAAVPGLLSLFALANPSPAVCMALEIIWRGIARTTQCDKLAHILVQGCRKTTAVTLVSNSKVEAVLQFELNPCPSAVLSDGLRKILFKEETHAVLQRFVFLAMVDDCGAHLYGVGVESSWAHDAGLHGSTEESQQSLFLSTIELACLEWPAESIFGDQTTLDAVVNTLTKLLPLSILCFRWALNLLPTLVSPETLQMCASQRLLEGSQSRREEARLAAALTGLFRTVDHLIAEGRIASDNNSDGELTDIIEVARVSQVKALEFLNTEETEQVASLTNVEAATAELIELTARICNGLDTQSSATVSVTITQVKQLLDEINPSRGDMEGTSFAASMDALVCVLLKTLFVSQDAFVSLHAVNSLSVIAMRRFDSPDTSVVSAWVYELLMLRGAGSFSTMARRLGMAARVDDGAVARMKVRLMDVLLSWCDYDTDGLTLRHVDDHCQKVYGTSLFNLLRHLCQSSEAAVVQVACLHLIGHYVCAVYPRVPLQHVVQHCKDVFRHTTVDMARPACAAMLAQVTEGLFSTNGDRALSDDVDLSSLKEIATAMSVYRSLPSVSTKPATDEDVISHDEIVRTHGKAIVERLKGLGDNLVQCDNC